MADSAEHGWHKSSVIITAVALFFTALAFYYQRKDKRQEQIKILDEKIQSFKARSKSMQEVPFVSVVLKTLKTSGLPESAFSNLSSIPAVVEVQHVSGETARDITVRVHATTPILKWVRQSSMDPFNAKIENNGKTLRLDIRELRRGETLYVTLYQHRLADIREEARIGEGCILPDMDRSPECQTDSAAQEQHHDDLQPGPSLASITPGKALNSSADDFKNLKELGQAITALEWSKRSLDDAPLFGFPLGFKPVYVLVLIGYVLFVFGVYWIRDQMAYKRKKRIESALGSLAEGMTKAQVEVSTSGSEPDRYSIVGVEPLTEVWLYKPYEKFLSERETAGAELQFEGDRLVKISTLKAEWKP